jgi:hypothetical protein
MYTASIQQIARLARAEEPQTAVQVGAAVSAQRILPRAECPGCFWPSPSEENLSGWLDQVPLFPGAIAARICSRVKRVLTWVSTTQEASCLG